MPGPLDGIRVIDLTGMVSGPLGAMILADQGADVIKVESPAGDSTRAVATHRGGFSASFLNNNRNKRSVVLDLKKDGAKEALLQLIASADVVMQNFRPGVADRLGIGYEAAKAVKPDVIYASISGFGEQRPLCPYAGVRPLGAIAFRSHLRAGQRPRAPPGTGAHHPARQADRLYRGSGHLRCVARTGADRRGPTYSPQHAGHGDPFSLVVGHGRPHLRGRGD